MKTFVLISCVTGMLKNIVNSPPLKVRCLYNNLLIYNSSMKPHIDYVIEIWRKHILTNYKEQNKLRKVLFHYNYLTSFIITKAAHSQPLNFLLESDS